MFSQDVQRKRLFERRYQGQFACSTFPQNAFKACKDSNYDFASNEAVEKAVIQYTKDNVAVVKESQV